MSPATEIAKLLTSKGFQPTYYASEPPTPDDVITVYDSVGVAPLHVEMEVRRPGIQVRVRDRSYDAGYARQVSVMNELLSWVGEEGQSLVFTGLEMSGDVYSLGRDENNRSILVANYQVICYPKGD